MNKLAGEKRCSIDINNSIISYMKVSYIIRTIVINNVIKIVIKFVRKILISIF